MKYRYIEDLINRYFEGATTTHEERLLKDFFQQEEVPAQFAKYTALFCELQEQSTISLPADFDERLRRHIAALEAARTPKTLKTRLLSLHQGLRPLYKAVASVTLIITVGVASSEYWSRRVPEPIEYSQPGVHDTQSGSEVARETTGEAVDTLTINNENYQNQP